MTTFMDDHMNQITHYDEQHETHITAHKFPDALLCNAFCPHCK